jgi:hypothetical protein
MRFGFGVLIMIFGVCVCISSGSGSSNATLQQIMDQKYIATISELPFSSGTPTVIWQQSGSIQGYIDIVGFRNLSRKGDRYFISGDPKPLAIVSLDATGTPSGIFDSLEKDLVLTKSGTNLMASLNVVMKWHTIFCDKHGCFVNGRFTDRATFNDIESIPVIISDSVDDIQVLYRELNFSLFNTTDIRIEINSSVYDRYLLTTKNGSYEKINRLWRVEQTAKGIYFANETVVNVFHSNNISHAQDILRVSDLNFTVIARGLYFSTDKMNVTVQKDNHDPLPQFLDGTLLGFLFPLGFFYYYIKRCIK